MPRTVESAILAAILQILNVCARVVGKRDDQKAWELITLYMGRRSRGTQRCYAHTLKVWKGHLLPRGVLEATRLDAERVAKAFQAKPGIEPRYSGSDKLSWATVYNHLARLRLLYELLVGHGLIKQNPFSAELVNSFRRQRVVKRPTEMMREDEARLLINSPTERDALGLRDRAILACLFGGGMRAGESVNLKLRDLGRTHRGTGFVRIFVQKNQKSDDHALPEWAFSRLVALKKAREEAGAEPGDYLCVSAKGIKLTHVDVFRMFKRRCRDLGLPAHYSPHSARATSITRLLEKVRDYRIVQEFSRHSTVMMVELYDKRRFQLDEAPQKGLEW